MEISRRSACDRCRGQKLRCVRSLPDDGAPSSSDRPLATCDRCRKAEVECINTLYAPRRQSGPESDSAEPIQKRSNPSILPKRANGLAANGLPFTAGQGLSTRRLGEMRPEQAYSSETQHMSDNPAKRRALDTSYNQVGFEYSGMNDSDLRLVCLQNARGGGAASSSSSNNALLAGCVDSDSGMPDRSPPIRTQAGFGNESMDFGMRSKFMIASQRPGSDPLSLGALLPPHSASKQMLSDGSDANAASFPPMKSLQDCQICLSEMGSRLVKIASDCAETCNTLEDILAFNAYFPRSQNSTLPKNAIGIVLEGSQAFLDILTAIRDLLLSQFSSPASPANSECSYSELWEGNDFISIADTGSASLQDDLMTFSSGSRGNGQSSTNNSSTNRIQGKCLDLLTTLTAFTCYASLLQIYNTVLICIHARVEGGSNSPLPSIIPDLTVGGFNLDGRRGLQIEIFLQLSAKMFERIEEVLGISVVSTQSVKHAGKGILETTSASALLDVIARQNGTDRCLTKHVRQTMDGIHELLARRDGEILV